MRLSHGFVRGESLNCIYHGWVYGANGGCSRIPAHPELVPPASIKAEVFSCAQANGVMFAGPAGATMDLPDLVGWRALRSMPFECSQQDLEQGLPGFAAVAPGRFEGKVTLGGTKAQLCLLVQELALGKRMVHALCGPQHDAVALSRWLEALRLRVEEEKAA